MQEDQKMLYGVTTFHQSDVCQVTGLASLRLNSVDLRGSLCDSLSLSLAWPEDSQIYIYILVQNTKQKLQWKKNIGK
jgi:hypothetical protein